MRRALVIFVALQAYSTVAVAARFAVAPYLQDARPSGVTVVFETDLATDAAVIVTLPTGEQRTASPKGTHHEVRIEGLPAGRFPYRVIAGDLTSEPATLSAAVAGSDFTFLVYGDNRDRDADHARVVAAMRREPADVILQTGDMTGDAGEEALWKRFFSIEAELLASTPMYPAIGNHEPLHDPTASHYHRYFALPSKDVITEDAERYYAFRFANTLFIALDGNQSHHKPQAEWLERTLVTAKADASIRHVFVFFHQPSFSVGEFCGSAAEQGLWVPEFERFGVRAVFTGHEHVYERLARNGIRYFVTGGGGAPLKQESKGCPSYDREALRLFRSAFHFLRVRVHGDEAELAAISVDGEVFDSIQLQDAPKLTPTTTVPYRDAPVRPAPMRSESRPLPGWLVAGLIALALGVAALLFGSARRR